LRIALRYYTVNTVPLYFIIYYVAIVLCITLVTATRTRVLRSFIETLWNFTMSDGGVVI